MGFTAVARTTGDERVLVHLLIQTFILLHTHGHLTETLQMSHPSYESPPLDGRYTSAAYYSQ